MSEDVCDYNHEGFCVLQDEEETDFVCPLMATDRRCLAKPEDLGYYCTDCMQEDCKCLKISVSPNKTDGVEAKK